MYSKLTVFV